MFVRGGMLNQSKKSSAEVESSPMFVPSKGTKNMESVAETEEPSRPKGPKAVVQKMILEDLQKDFEKYFPDKLKDSQITKKLTLPAKFDFFHL